MLVKLKKLVAAFLFIGINGALIIACLFVFQFLIITSYSQFSARSLAPPEYPNGELLGSWQSGGPDMMWDRRTYRTSDSVEEVFSYMEERMPGFTEKEDSTRDVVYSNHATNTNWLAQRAAEYACTSLYCIEKESALTYPSASITFYSDPENLTDTLIEVWLSWPAQ